MINQLMLDGFSNRQKSTDWKWTMKEDYPQEKSNLRVFSCFSCGGGSTMGYKLAGCEVIGNCEIDKQMNEVYVANHHPKFNYCMDIREFNKLPDNELPQELFNLDILDGSPPCTTFSTAGEREDSWGKKKKFREGQAEQTLDDLSFVFIETVKKLKPKCVIMENVEGLLIGNAWSYVQKIYADFKAAGYQVKHYLCKGENMGIPQKRHRVFFIAFRVDIKFDFDNLDMYFDYEPVLYGDFKSENEKHAQGKISDAVKQVLPNESIKNAMWRLYRKKSALTHTIAKVNEVMPTLTAGHMDMWTENGNHPSIEDMIISQTFPLDYDFIKRTYTKVCYICGMSVPPVMIKRIVNRIIDTGVFENEN